MTDLLPAPPELDPASLAASEFTRVRKGLEATEVRAALGRAADALRTWAERDARMHERVTQLEQRLDESHELDEGRIAAVLGEETARIVTAARDAAAEIRTKAEEQAERLIRESEEQATATAQALRGEAQVLRDEAAKLRDDAAADVEAARRSAVEDAARMRDEAEADAASQREEAAALATATVSDAQARSDELLARAELVLSERTAEAEEAAGTLTAAAQEAAARTAAEAEETRASAASYAEEVRADADAAAAGVAAQAAISAAEVIEQATSQGRAMVAEARAVRERMLRDVVEKKHAARRQLEGALAGRDRIVEVLRSVGEELASTIGELEAADAGASAAADEAAAAVDSQLDLEAEIELLHGELTEEADEMFSEAEITAGAGTGSSVASTEATVAEGVSADDVAPVEDVQAAEVDEVVGVDVATDEEPLVDGEEVAASDADARLSVVESDADAEEPTPAEEAADELAAAPEDHGHVPAQGAGATVHDLFARIRAEGSGDEETGDEEAGEEEAGDWGNGGEMNGADAVVVDEIEDVVVDLTIPEGPEQLLDRRDAVLVPVEKGLARVLKRLASDEQNEILDRLRRVKRGRPEPAEILPSDDPAPFLDALGAEFAHAVDAGADFWSELGEQVAPHDLTDPRVHDALETRVREFLSVHRAHLSRAFEEADEAAEDTAELADRVRSTYRDWRSGSLADLAGDLATAGFALGEMLAAGDGTRWRWVVDHGGLACADGEDNALAGDVLCGEPFPTGDVTPPAHPGCRCILAPAAR